MLAKRLTRELGPNGKRRGAGEAVPQKSARASDRADVPGRPPPRAAGASSQGVTRAGRRGHREGGPVDPATEPRVSETPERPDRPRPPVRLQSANGWRRRREAHAEEEETF